MKHKNYKFKGYSYIELGKAFSLNVSEKIITNEEKNVEKIRDFLWNVLGSDEEKWVTQNIRKYIEAMLEYQHMDYFAPMYRGMLKIENDECLIKATIHLLPLMWT